jgi:hypothetical protein
MIMKLIYDQPIAATKVRITTKRIASTGPDIIQFEEKSDSSPSWTTVRPRDDEQKAEWLEEALIEALRQLEDLIKQT